MIDRGNQFEAVEENTADTEIGRLRADLSAMMTRIEVHANQSKLAFPVCDMLLNILFWYRTWQGSLSSDGTSLSR